MVLLLAVLPAAGAAAGGGQPFFQDDFPKESLEQAIGYSLNYFNKIPADRSFKLCGRAYSAAWLAETLRTFKDCLDKAATASELDRMIRERFDMCQAEGSSGSGEMLVTGYYEPALEGSLTRKPPYLHPVYAVPPDLATEASPEGTGKKRVGRRSDGKLAPYWTRAEIENNNLLAGHELVYLADPADAFFLQVEGSGRVTLRDGTVRSIQYAAKNGRPYRSIGRLLVKEGKMSLDQASLPGIRAYLASHPEDRQRILHHNESWIFFKWGEDGVVAPLGSLGQPLTPQRSVALDHSCFPSGALGYLQSKKPVLDKGGRVTGWQRMSRFVLNQDCGSAIQGTRRLDFFWGNGSYAEAAAGLMKQPGWLYFLVKKRKM